MPTGMLFTTPGCEDYIGGVILYDETIRQAADDGTPFAELLAEKGIVPGIKVDTGAQPLAGHPDEKVTEGLDGLRARIDGVPRARRALRKWRAVITIGDDIPSRRLHHVNAHALARYAALCQEEGIVPIVEPEVLMDGDTLDRELLRGDVARRCTAVRGARPPGRRPRRDDAQAQHGHLRQGLPDAGSTGRRSRSGRSSASSRTSRRWCPGIVFLSGGQSEVEATANLDAMNRIGGPWPLSFSYGRALQASALKAWGGDPASVDAGQDAFLHRSRMNALAVAGDWSADVEQAVPA